MGEEDMTGPSGGDIRAIDKKQSFAEYDYHAVESNDKTASVV
jgi:hypothetical protein